MNEEDHDIFFVHVHVFCQGYMSLKVINSCTFVCINSMAYFCFRVIFIN